jgi:hypothetical protein
LKQGLLILLRLAWTMPLCRPHWSWTCGNPFISVAEHWIIGMHPPHLSSHSLDFMYRWWQKKQTKLNWRKKIIKANMKTERGLLRKRKGSKRG